MDNSSLLLFLTTALTALAMENTIFARALGLSKASLFLKSSKVGILYGGVLTWIVTLTSILVSGVNELLVDNPYVRYIRAPMYLCCVCIIYVLTHLLTQKYAPRLFAVIAPALPISTFNSALFGVFYLSSSNTFNFFQTTGYALGSGVGYTLALLIIYYARKRLAISPVPRSFRGLPILLVYIGLLSLAIYGLIGHGLPV